MATNGYSAELARGISAVVAGYCEVPTRYQRGTDGVPMGVLGVPLGVLDGVFRIRLELLTGVLEVCSREYSGGTLGRSLWSIMRCFGHSKGTQRLRRGVLEGILGGTLSGALRRTRRVLS